MSLHNVERAISRLMSEEELRLRFVLDRFDAVAELHERGITLTPTEIDALVQSDSQIWFSEHGSFERCTH
jgi:hypothetical protein